MKEKKLFNFLKKPYPFNDDLRHNAKIIFFISIGILAFLLIFQPIEINNFTQKDIFYLVTGLAISTFLVLSINLIIIPSLLPKLFNRKNWDIKREIAWNIWILLAISSSDLLFFSKLFDLFEIHFSDILNIIFLGFLPVAVLIVINQDRILRSNLKSARLLNEKLQTNKEKDEKLITFHSDYKKDKLSIKPSSLLFMKSSDNYIEIYYLREKDLKKQMIRSTLKNAEELVKGYDFIIRCHRGYMVNTNHVKEIVGNSQGYKLYFENIDFPVLVSQKFIPELIKIIK